jgi:hypothetical protein
VYIESNYPDQESDCCILCVLYIHVSNIITPAVTPVSMQEVISVFAVLVDLYFCKCAGRPNLQKACFEHI